MAGRDEGASAAVTKAAAYQRMAAAMAISGAWRGVQRRG